MIICRLRIYNIVVALIAFITIVGCERHTHAWEQLDRAERLLNTNPDSAYTLMSKLDVSSWSHGERMRYELMKTDAQNKADILLTSDSIMKEVVEYFDNYGTNNERVRAYYLLGSVYRDMDSIQSALNAFNKATEIADTTGVDCDWGLLSSVHAQASGCFRKLSLFDYAISENEKDLYYCLKAGNHFNYANSTEQLGNIYFYEDSLEKAKKLYWKAYHLFKKFSRRDAAITLGPIIGTLVRQEKFIECGPLFYEYENYSGFYDKNGNITKGREAMYCDKGLYLISKGEYSSAENYLRRALVNSASDSLYAFLGLARLFKETGRVDSAYKYSICSQNLLKKIYTIQAKNHQKGLKAIYDYSQNKQKEDYERVMRFRTGIIVFVAVIVLVMVLYVIYILHRRNRRRILSMAKNYAADVLKMIDLQREHSELILEHEILMQEKDRISAEYDSAEKEKMQFEEQISKLSRAIFESQKQSDHNKSQTDRIMLKEDNDEPFSKSMMFSSVVYLLHSYAKKGATADERDWDLFLKTACECMPDFISILQEANGGLKPKELYICLLVKLRFHSSEICCLMDMKSNTLANTRRRLLKKIFDMEGRASEFDMKITTLLVDKGL